MGSVDQNTFFETLLNQKEFPQGTNIEGLRQQFANLDTKSASAWIEKALTLPDKGFTPPAF